MNRLTNQARSKGTLNSVVAVVWVPWEGEHLSERAQRSIELDIDGLMATLLSDSTPRRNEERPSPPNSTNGAQRDSPPGHIRDESVGLTLDLSCHE